MGLLCGLGLGFHGGEGFRIPGVEPRASLGVRDSG